MGHRGHGVVHRVVRVRLFLLVPLVGPHHVGDWQAVTGRLARTVESLRRQEGAWRAVICCQERPPLPDDPRLIWLPFTDPMPGNDKWRKLAALCDHLCDDAVRELSMEATPPDLKLEKEHSDKDIVTK